MVQAAEQCSVLKLPVLLLLGYEIAVLRQLLLNARMHALTVISLRYELC